MVWLAVIGLAIWIFVGQERVSALRRELTILRQGLQPPQPSTRPAAREAPPAPAAPRPAPPPVEGVAAAPTLETAPLLPRLPPASIHAHQSEREPPLFNRAVVEAWLSEKGLAWIGGAALVIGGAFLVGFAAQHGLFGPPMRIAAACLLGVLMLGAGEAVRRGRLAGFGQHRLAAAILSGAGAAMLYGAAWAAYALYGFISGGVCVAILAAISAGLMTLAFLHGEALALLAIGGAYVAPLVGGRQDWPVEATSLYLGVLVAAGAGVAWLRRWPAAGWTNQVAAALWSLMAAAAGERWKSLLLGLEPLAVIALLAWRWPARVDARIGSGAIAAASLAVFVTLAQAYAAPDPMLLALLAGLALPFLTVVLQRKGHAPAAMIAAPGVAFTLAAVSARLEGHHDLLLTGLWCVQILAMDAAGLWMAWREDEDGLGGRAAAFSSAALGLVASLGLAAAPLAALAPSVACVGLTLATLRLARDPDKARHRTSLEVWSGAAAASLLIAIATGFSARWAGLGFAAAALGLALLGRRLGWRSLAISAAAAGALGFASLLSPDMLRHALAGGAGAAFMLGVGLMVALAAFAAARLIKAEAMAAEALRTVSPLAALAGAFVFLRWAAGARTGLPLDALTEASLRTLLIAVAGLASLARIDRETSAFARWRGHLLMGAAALHGAVLQGLLYNPRWSPYGDLAGGVVFLNGLALAYLAPAFAFGLAAARSYRQNRIAGRVYALISLACGVLWAFLEIRRLFHGPHLAGGGLSIGAGEALGTSAVLLMLGIVTGALRRRMEARGTHPFFADAGRSLAPARAIAVLYALWMTGIWSNPWWGPAAGHLASFAALAGVLAGYGVLALLTARLAFDADRDGRRLDANLIGLGAMAQGVTLATLGVRAAFHGLDLTALSPVGQLETWAYSATWAAIGLGFIGASRLGGRLFLRAGLALLLITTGKVFLFDTASLSGVVRAGSFLALGVVLLLGALTARRVAQALRSAPAPGGP